MLFALEIFALGHLTRNLLTVGGAEWERQQRAGEANAPAGAPPRNYRVTMLAEGVFEGQFFHKLVQLFGPTMWSAMPRDSCTEDMNSIAFIMFSGVSGAGLPLPSQKIKETNHQVYISEFRWATSHKVNESLHCCNRCSFAWIIFFVTGCCQVSSKTIFCHIVLELSS